MPKTILITGASSGIGAALARSYAGPGKRLALLGRDRHRLGAVVAACTEAGAEVRSAQFDVRDRSAMQSWIVEVDQDWQLDLVVANAGASNVATDAPDQWQQDRETIAINFDGVLNTVHPVLPAMMARGRGQLALMSSVASFRGLQTAPAYCAAKAGIRVYGEALRDWGRHHGIRISVICPGFVATPLTARNRFSMPFLMSAERAAAIIRRGLARNRGRILFPWQMRIATWLMVALPDRLVSRLVRGPGG